MSGHYETNRQDWASRVIGRGALALTYAITIMLLWEAAFRVFQIPQWLAAPPSKAIASLASLPAFYARHTTYTALNAVCGLLLAVAIGVLTGMGLGTSVRSRRLVTPLLLAVNTFPIVAIAPLLTVFLGYGMASKVSISFLISWMPIVFNTTRGFASTPTEFQNLALICSMSRTQRIWFIQIPFAMPFISAGIKIAAPASVLGSVVGEFAGGRGLGLGTVILGAGSDIGVERVYASLILLACVGGVFFLTVSSLDAWVNRVFTGTMELGFLKD